MSTLTVAARPVPDGDRQRTRVRAQRTVRRRVLLYLAPVSAILLVVYVVPLGATVWYSLQKTSYYNLEGFGGIDAFARLFASDDLWNQVLTTVAYSLGNLVIAVPLGFACALVLDRIRRFTRLTRSLLLLPWLMSQATAGAIWMWFLNPSYGSASYLATELGLGQLTVFSDPQTALPALVVITAWWSYPQAMLLYMGALKTIPVELFESTRVDGGGAWHVLRYVILPYVRNTTVSVIVVLLMLYVQMVTIILVTTRGGPLGSTETLSMGVYNRMFLDYDLSGASAMALLLFLVNTALTLVAIRFRRKETV